MKTENDNVLIGLVIAFALVAFYFLGYLDGKDAMRKQAIESKVAEWRIDAVTGKSNFYFKAQK
jgi:hypothetical protein